MKKAKLIANGGFFLAQVLVLSLGFSAGTAPTWLTVVLTALACIAVFATGVANYAEGLDRGAENARRAMMR